MRRLFLMTIAATLVAAPAAASLWRSTISLPERGESIPALDAFVIAEQLADSVAVRRALERTDWPAHIRHWCAARWEGRLGQVQTALELFHRAAETWPAGTAEPAVVLELFDRQRLILALDSGDLEAARDILRSPLRPHHGAVWRALRARVELESGDAIAAADRFARAWEQATPLQRRDPVFLHGARAHFAVGDTVAAVLAWQSSLESIRRPERLRAALAVWDSSPALQAAVAESEDPRTTIRFLVRVLRRDEARAVVEARLRDGREEPARGALFVAEQFYRLRQHDRLNAWLDSLDVTGWDAEQQATVEGYRWGVQRRSGVSVEVGAGFDSLVEAWPGTPRAAEAMWESAWMYELSDLPEDAVQRYADHVEATTEGRFRSSAALRTVFLPLREGDVETGRTNHERFAVALGTGMNQAAAWWLLDEANGTDEFRARLQEEHPASPLWRGLAPQIAPDETPGVQALHEQQLTALMTVGTELSIDDPLQDLPAELAAVARIGELGLKTEATVRLGAWARANGSDEQRLRAVAVAFAVGLPEMQGRQGWFLERRLRGRTLELDAALRALALPTPFAGTVGRIGRELDLPPALLWALVRRESFFDPDVVSLAGAYGLMQLLPRTANRVAAAAGMEIPSPSLLYVPSINLSLGARYLAGLRKESGGNWVRALASYNAGENNGKRWEERLREGENPALGILLISYTETRSYVYNVLRVTHLYEDIWRSGP
jgi:soluble lytic murein transglycosylase-like protein